MLSLVLSLSPFAPTACAQDWNALQGEPVHYEQPASAGPVERLGARLSSGELRLAHDPAGGFLPALLEELAIPVSSQVLVFSKTSLQAELISPSSPRALYFGEAAYVGSIPGAPLIELTSIDPERGPVFYTLERSPTGSALLVRRDDDCMQCHAGSRTRGLPGLLLRSVHPAPDGLPILRSGTTTVDHSTPFEERWGGWYVSGNHGAARHRGNAIAELDSEVVDLERGANVEDLSTYFRTERYLSPHSDLVALLVLEHQAEMHNRIARASYAVRLALHREQDMNRLFDEPAGTRRPSTRRILDAQARALLEYALFDEESRLPAQVEGSSSFAADFQALGRRDARGRSLRDLDLDLRLFRYPCSYLLHSEAFAALPEELLEVVYATLWRILAGPNEEGPGAGLSETERVDIREILLATQENLPSYWSE